VAQRPIGEILVELGALDGAALDRALRAQRQHGGRIGDVLRGLGLISEDDWARAVAAKTGLELIDADDFPAAPLYAAQVSEKFLIEACVLPVAETDRGLLLAMADPLDRYAAEAMELVAGRPILPCVATERDISAAVKRLYRNGADRTDAAVEEAGFDDAALSVGDVERLKDMASEAPVIRLVNTILARALEARASDIHIEPFEHELIVRYRIDGMLREVEPPPVRLAAAIVSRVKIMARLNIAERRLAQDGRIRLQMMGKELDLRVSTVPNLHGESVVMRILEHNPVAIDFPALGLDDAGRARMLDILDQRHGIMLVTGPTGSGKTTTLYAALSHLNQPERKIITVEDPVEYQIRRVIQIQVKPEIGLNFANVLRSIVRQDPDVIMIGEMRDLETAEIAVQSALTGHVVLSTLHTNDAAGAITRLLDMGVDDYLLTSTVNGVVGQRLVRVLCPECRTPYVPDPGLAERLNLARYTKGGPATLYRPVGCRACDGLGYTGRIAIFELMAMDAELRALVMRRADSSMLLKAAVAGGMITMFEDGLKKVLAGVTTIEEVRRVTREY